MTIVFSIFAFCICDFPTLQIILNRIYLFLIKEDLKSKLITDILQGENHLKMPVHSEFFKTVLYLPTDVLSVSISYLFTKEISLRNTMNPKVIKSIFL